MKRKIKLLTLSYLVFLVFNLLSGMADGIISEIFLFLAFMLPVAAVLFADRKSDVDSDALLYLRLDRRGVDLILALGIPCVVLVAILSFLTALVIDLTLGVKDAVALPDSYLAAVLTLAFLPALMEELLFRYLPMKLLLPHSATVTVMFSSIMFAAAHCSVFQLIYALVAGVIFMSINIASRSVIPSLILHFVNNFISVTALYFKTDSNVILWLNVIICLLFVASCVYLALKHKSIIENICGSIQRGEEYSATAAPLCFILPAMVLALSDIVMKLGG